MHAPAARARALQTQPPRVLSDLAAAGGCAEFQGVRATRQGCRAWRRPSHSCAASAAAAACTRRSWAQTRRVACPRAAGERAGEQQASLSDRGVRRAHAKTRARARPRGRTRATLHSASPRRRCCCIKSRLPHASQRLLWPGARRSHRRQRRRVRRHRICIRAPTPAPRRENAGLAATTRPAHSAARARRSARAKAADERRRQNGAWLSSNVARRPA